MKRKFIPLALLLTLAGSAAFAQTSLQVKGGVNLANVSTKNDGSIDENKQLTSFNVGILANLPLGTKILSFQPGIVYTGKGSKTQIGSVNSSTYYLQEFNPRYIEIPANLVVKLPLGDRSGIFVGAGPYLGIGIGGKTSVEGKILGVDYNREESIEYSNDDPTTEGEEGARFDRLRRFDYGLNGTAGIETKTFVISANYGYGLAKLQSGTDSDENDRNKHRVLSFTLGYKF